MSTSNVADLPGQSPADPPPTSHCRLQDIAEFLGISQTEAVQRAIDIAWKHLEDTEDMSVELAFARHGRTIGGVVFLGEDEAFIERAQKRYDERVPLWILDDEGLDRNFFVGFLTNEQKQQVRAASEPLEKRRLILKFMDETSRRQDISFDPS